VQWELLIKTLIFENEVPTSHRRAAAIKEALEREQELEQLQAERELAESAAEARVTRAAGLAIAAAEESELAPVQQKSANGARTRSKERNLAMSAHEL